MGDVDFHAHAHIPRGLKEGLWRKVRNVKGINVRIPVIFCRSDDFGDRVKMSKRWRVWRFQEPSEYVGELVTDEHKKAEISPIVPPKLIIDQVKTGVRPYSYPAGTEIDLFQN